jgi:hypothetical protein
MVSRVADTVLVIKNLVQSQSTGTLWGHFLEFQEASNHDESDSAAHGNTGGTGASDKAPG